MAIHHLTVTLNGSVQALATPSAGTPSIPCQWLRIESETGNADVKVGGSTMTSTDYGAIVTAGATNGLIIISSQGLAINLASTYVLGTNTQKIHILYVT